MRFLLNSMLFVALSGCASVPVKVPPACSPMLTAVGDPPSGQIVCTGSTWAFPDAGQFECFLPTDIEPCIERCSKVTPDWLMEYALRFVGIPYLYGGKHPLTGLDCSGLVTELLEAVGIIPFGFQTNAQGLHDHFLPGVESVGLGALAFFGADPKHVDHVGFCLDSVHMIEAGGGHTTTVDLASAILTNAFVKVRPIKYRKDFLTVVMPPYVWLQSGA